jgi:hypothetical protein
VGIGLLEPNRNELVYKAGSGNAAKDVGRRFPAVLSASPTPEMRREILRVENAGSDTRIEAEICRQFGAISVVMLPIYKDRVLVGVLQVLFEEAHSFHERELRAYRLMIGALEEGMLRSRQLAPEEAPAVAVRSVPVKEAEAVPLVQSAEHVAESSGVVAHCIHQEVSPEVSGNDLTAFWQSEAFSIYKAIVVRELARLRRRFNEALGSVKIHPWSAYFRSPEAAIGAALILSMVVWIAHRSGVANEKLDFSRSISRDARLQAPSKAMFGNEADETSKSLSSESKEASGSVRGFKRVRIGPSEVDYISDDVTIRKFEPIHPKPQIRSVGREVNFGDDVTVRYFAKSPALASQSSNASGATAGTKAARSE